MLQYRTRRAWTRCVDETDKDKVDDIDTLKYNIYVEIKDKDKVDGIHTLE